MGQESGRLVIYYKFGTYLILFISDSCMNYEVLIHGQ